MPLKKRSVFSILIALIFIGFSFYFYKTKTSEPFKRQFLQSSFTSKGVVNRVLQIKLNYDQVDNNSEKSEISAEVYLPFNFDEKLYYRWRLGQDVYYKEGLLTGEINGLSANEPKKVYLIVTGFSKEAARQIKFEIYGIKDGKNIYGDSIISSDIENTFENTVQNVERIKASE